MKNIKIIDGVYGLRKSGSSVVTRKGKTDPPFQIEDDEAKRLVALGVAAYVDETPVADNDKTGKLVDTLNLSQLKRLNRTTLEGIAKKLGLDVSKAPNKETCAEEIWSVLETRHAAVVAVDKDTYEVVEEAEAEVEDDEDVEDTEDPPTPGADEPVT